jgi:hypothetical protein
MKRAEDLGDDWAEKDAAFGMLDDTKKNLEGRLVSPLLDEGIPVTKAVYYAHAKQEYANYIKNLSEAREAKNKASVKYKTYLKWIDLIQTKEANQRAEMKIK